MMISLLQVVIPHPQLSSDLTPPSLRVFIANKLIGQKNYYIESVLFLKTGRVNAREHSTKQTQDKRRWLWWENLPHPPFSPDLKPPDFHLFQSLEHFISSKTFRNKEVENGFSNSYNVESNICLIIGLHSVKRKVITFLMMIFKWI